MRRSFIILLSAILYAHPSFSTNEETYGDPLVAKYRQISKDPAQALFSFDHPLWKVSDSLPDELKEKNLIHQWYLIGRQITDEYKKFCYLFAAGRAGHYYAAHEAGEMLLSKDVSVIPLKVTLEDLNAQIPIMKVSEVIRDWDVCMLNQDVISDPDLRDFFQIGGDTPVRLLTEFAKKVKSLRKDQKSQALEALNGTIRQLKPLPREHCTGVLSKMLVRDDAHTNCEYSLLNSVLPLLEQGWCYTLYDSLLEILDEMASIPNTPANYLINKIKTLKKEFPKSKFKQDAELFMGEHEKHKMLPTYRYILQDLYDSLADMFKTDEYKTNRTKIFIELLNVRLNAELLGDIADEYYKYQLLVARKALSSDELIQCYRRVTTYYIMSCLLGETYYMDEMIDLESDLLASLGSVTKLSKSFIINELTNEFNPIMAFCLQLNLLRNPESTEVLSALRDFYQRGLADPNDRSGIKDLKFINEARYREAFSVCAEIENRESQSAKTPAKNEGRMNRAAQVHLGLKTIYLDSVTKLLGKASSLYLRKEQHLFEEAKAELNSKLFELQKGIDHLKRQCIPDKRILAADFKSSCNNLEAQIRQLYSSLEGVIVPVEPVARQAAEPVWGDLETIQDLRAQTREVKEQAARRIMAMSGLRSANIIENSNNDVSQDLENSVVRLEPFKIARFEVLCGQEPFENTLKTKAFEILSMVRSSQNKDDLMNVLSELSRGYNFEILKLSKGSGLRINSCAYSNIEQAWSLRLNDRIRFCVLWIKDQEVPVLVVGEYEH